MHKKSLESFGDLPKPSGAVLRDRNLIFGFFSSVFWFYWSYLPIL